MKLSTERDYRRRIARVIEAILIDPGAAHTVHTLATVAHLSPFHFHRIYRAMTGESITETVQRLRLAQAAHQLTVTDDTVTGIALAVGYDSPQAFARAFRCFAGISPSAFQARQKDLTTPLNQSVAGIRDDESAGKVSPLIQLIELPPIDALCIRHTGPIATIGQTFKTLLRTLYPHSPATIRQNRIGICSGDPEDGDSFRYLAGIAPLTPIEPVAGIETIHIPGGLYASHRLVGPYALIAPTFRAMFGGWLPRSGYEPDDRPTLEFYHDSPSSGLARNCVTDLLIPIRKGD